MENSIAKQIENYKSIFSNSVPQVAPKFKKSLGSELDIRAKISASYELVVERYGGHIIMDQTTSNSLSAVTSWIYDDPHRWLLLYGSLGNGKTTMLWALSAIVYPSILISAQNIFDYFRKNEVLPEIPDSNVLLIDDLGIEPLQCKLFGEDRVPLAELLAKRYSSRATTVIATNLSIDDIQARYGDRVADRMAEVATAVLYDAPSYR